MTDHPASFKQLDIPNRARVYDLPSAMSTVAPLSPRGEPIGQNRQEVASVLGMSAVFILEADRGVCVIHYAPRSSVDH